MVYSRYGNETMIPEIPPEAAPEIMKKELLAHLASHGQEHLLDFWDELDDGQRVSLARQIGEIDFDLIDRLYPGKDDQSDIRELADRAAPPPAIRLNTAENPFTPQEARQRGEQAIAAGQVGVILVAGGQGTRLGFDDPKGMFPIGPVSGHTLFQIHVEKIVARSTRYGVQIPLYLMTSPATHDRTVEFFDEHGRFGLAEEDFGVFCQGTMPVVDAATGLVLLEGPDRIAVSPDGHGGLLAALASTGTFEAIRQRGIENLFYFQVDNPMVDICSPEFTGYHLLSGSKFTSQVVDKERELEYPVGNVVEGDVEGHLQVVEYSDLETFLEEENPSKEARRELAVKMWAGSIAVHVMDVGFLQGMAGRPDGLPFHQAKKTVAHINSSGQRVEPENPNAIKFERFIFDLMPLANKATLVEVKPQEAFAPLKKASGEKEDTPEIVRIQMVTRHRDWLSKAGVEVDRGVDVEISPLWALDAEEVARKSRPGTRVTEPRFFC